MELVPGAGLALLAVRDAAPFCSVYVWGGTAA